MSRSCKVISTGLVMILLIVVFIVTRDADEPEYRDKKTSLTENGTASAGKVADTAATGDPDPVPFARTPDFSLYIVHDPINGIMFTYPGYTIADHAVPLDQAELKTVRQHDGTFLKRGIYHLVKIQNSGPMRLHWTGYADGNFQVLLSYWNSERFIQRDIRDARENATYTIDIDRPVREEFVYILINCTGGSLYTDEIRVEITGGIQNGQPGR